MENSDPASAADALSVGIHLHLRIQVKPGLREQFLAFLREATPFYEQPGGIRVSLLTDLADDHRFIEVVKYASIEIYERDQERVRTDPTMGEYLRRWREMLVQPPGVEMFTQSRP